MRIAVIGTGYVGLVSGACFSQFGFQVTCVDHDLVKVATLNQNRIPIYEPGLEDIVATSRRKGHLTFTTDLSGAVGSAELALIAVGTPTGHNGDHADLTYVFEAGRQIARAAKSYLVVVIKSTVPVGTAAKLRKIMAEANPQADFEVCSNPEFLREGSAVDDFMVPDRIVVGVQSARSEAVLRRLYQPLIAKGVPFIATSSESAELIKYAANSYLALRIGFVNQLTDICEAVDADIAEVARGVGLDKRIGPQYFAPGPGYGGSCFPKDTRALAATARDYAAPITIIEDVILANERRQDSLAGRVAGAAGGDIRGKRIAVLGIAFKAETDDIRDTPALKMIPGLQALGAKVAAYDPAAMANAKQVFDAVDWCENVTTTVTGADVVVIATEWDEFRGLDLIAMRKLVRGALLVDLRNIFGPEDVSRAGFTYHSLGRKPVAAQAYP
jgi:UDPglucose 6-dehydrogenase